MTREKLSLLKKIRLGQRVAEEEVESLEGYFVETNQWNEIFEGEKDLVFGPKGSGKSALYALLNKRSRALDLRGVEVVLAENPIGATVFNNLEVAPPPSEIAFVLLWKLYALTLISSVLRGRESSSEEAQTLVQAMTDANLLPKRASRESLFRSVRNSISALFDKQVSAIETSVVLDPTSGMPVLGGRLELARNPDLRADALPVGELLQVADEALSNVGSEIWILFDRLDVAFSENADLERNALRALLRTYRDLRSLKNIVLKLFIRDDVWDRVTDQGFAEASHFIRSTAIEWDRDSLRDLATKRLASNEALRVYLGASEDDLIGSPAKQESLLKRIFPAKVEIGKNPDTFDWMLSRISDGSKKASPRELIHMLDELRRIQIDRLEKNEGAPSGELLFDRIVFKQALKRVSTARYDQTFKQENASLTNYTEALRGKKAEQTLASLAALWDTDVERSREIADKLYDAGFFERRGAAGDRTYWVPFVYRDALELVQGRADL